MSSFAVLGRGPPGPTPDLWHLSNRETIEALSLTVDEAQPVLCYFDGNQHDIPVYESASVVDSVDVLSADIEGTRVRLMQHHPMVSPQAAPYVSTNMSGAHDGQGGHAAIRITRLLSSHDLGVQTVPLCTARVFSVGGAFFTCSGTLAIHGCTRYGSGYLADADFVITYGSHGTGSETVSLDALCPSGFDLAPSLEMTLTPLD